ncbi:substrate-binding and VWA domain-containing protein [Salinispora arenicola]|uniref:substrate-binding and VWA domain-containing protein n=1 Tax=Salinispora arenicola TaxID=168697 RepID=UPI00207AB589|nr:substrate-binding domain-containing protein [Salinispora arenicola]MCN0179643.1 substrate-binding and VWA domain-containing protein [Salinispora arenicola]
MSPGRHRIRTNVRAAGAAAAAGVLAVAAGGYFGYRQLASPGCSGQIELAVAVASELAPAVDTTATEWENEGAVVGGTCIEVNVTASDPVEVAATVAAKHGAVLAGVGQASGTAISPDVWVPDSSAWLLRLKTGGATAFDPGNRASIAYSPVVVGVPEPIATQLGWPESKLTWSGLVGQVNNSKPIKAGTVNPTRDAAGLSGLIALSAAAGAGENGQAATVGALRALSTNSANLRQELLAKFPTSPDSTSVARGLGAAALSEEDVLSYNARKPAVPLVPLYLEPAAMPLDYPYAVLPGIEPAKASAAQMLFEVLATASFKDRLAPLSLRAPDGTWGAGFGAPQGAPSSEVGGASTEPGSGDAAGAVDPVAVDRAVASWSIATQSGRMLCVIDVSGSMKGSVAGAGGASRQQVTLDAARRGLSLFDDSWQIGLWEFSTNLGSGRDYRRLVEIGPLSNQRSRLEQALTQIQPTRGDTGLFDTVLAAYEAVQEEWDPGQVNSIVLFTDGKNDDDNGISQQQLLAELERIKDAERPVQVVLIGIGADVSKAELESITKVTGGGSFVTEDPTKIGDIFLKAIALRKPGA